MPALALNHTYRALTDEIEIQVRPFYMPERSDPKAGVYFYGYQITMTNHGATPVQLIERHWVVRDGQGKEEQVRGKGVVGQNPVIAPSENYQYSSFCPLNTPTGNMRGSYIFQAHDGDYLEVKIPLFFFRRPETFRDETFH